MKRWTLVLTKKLHGNVGLRAPDGTVWWFHVDYEHELREIRARINRELEEGSS